MEIDRIFSEFRAVNGTATVTLNGALVGEEKVTLQAKVDGIVTDPATIFTIVEDTKDKAVVKYTFPAVTNNTATAKSVVITAKVGEAVAKEATAFVVDEQK